MNKSVLEAIEDRVFYPSHDAIRDSEIHVRVKKIIYDGLRSNPDYNSAYYEVYYATRELNSEYTILRGN